MRAVQENATQRALYHQVAEHIEKLVAAGTLRPGERVPSVRKLQQQMKVSLSTVLSAYQLLESKGVIAAKPQSGFYVRSNWRQTAPKPDVTRPEAKATDVKIACPVLEMFRGGVEDGVLRFGGAVPPAHCLPTVRLNRIMASIARRAANGANTYDRPKGQLEYRTQVAKLMLSAGCTLSPDDLVSTVGCSEAVGLALRAVTNPGDLVAIESPVYYGHLLLLEALQLRAIEIDTCSEHGLEIDALEYAIARNRIAAVLVNGNHQNPLGYCMPDENKQALVELCERHQIPIVEDDIYGDLTYGDERPRVCKTYDKTGNVLLCSSFSKTIAPGFRVGWLAPGRWMNKVMELKFGLTISTPPLAQRTIAEYLAVGGYARHLRSINRTYALQVNQYAESIVRHFPEGTKLTRPHGNFVLWAEVPMLKDAMHLQKVALAQGIAIAPGPIFSPSRRYQNCVRITCGELFTDRIDDGIARLGKLVREC